MEAGLGQGHLVGAELWLLLGSGRLGGRGGRVAGRLVLGRDRGLLVEFVLDLLDNVQELRLLGPFLKGRTFVVECTLSDIRVGNLVHYPYLGANYWKSFTQDPTQILIRAK